MLPGEQEYAEKVQHELAEALDVGAELLGLALEIICHRLPTISASDQDKKHFAYRAGHALCIKACKSFRSSLLLAEIGATNDLTIVSRSMFETYVAANFVLRDYVELGLKGVDDTALTPNDRASLYLAFQYINRYEELKNHLADPDLSKVLLAIDPKPIEENANDAAKDIGQDWAERFRKRPRTYSGLSLKELSSRLGPNIIRWYTTVYGEQSKATHATDFKNHVVYSDSEMRFQTKWFPPIDHVKHLVGINGLMLWGCLELLDKQFKFAEETESHLQIFLPLLGRVLGANP